MPWDTKWNKQEVLPSRKRQTKLRYYNVIHFVQRYIPSDSTEEGATNSS